MAKELEAKPVIRLNCGHRVHRLAHIGVTTVLAHGQHGGWAVGMAAVIRVTDGTMPTELHPFPPTVYFDMASPEGYEA